MSINNISVKRKLIPANDPEAYPCPLCGSNDYEYGTVMPVVSTYTPESAGLFKTMMNSGKNNIKVRVCRNCGHLIFLVDER